MRLAIVVPTLNEEEALARTLPAALSQADEVVISDGGSTDRTRQIAEELGARTVCGPPGRGGQLNRGAAAAQADLLLFLHADTELPPNAAARIRTAVAEGALGGAFFLRFDVDRPQLRLGAWLINQRTRLTRLPLGDQAHYATRALFERLGGFKDWPILEDLDFAWRLRKEGQMKMIDDRVTTAARRFLEGGVIRTVATNWLIWSLFCVGVSPHRLARLYKQIR
ncbi:MAG TPA: TIGR04283 family arsenosugar biosynthesis glycosyltransferase [Thermoanaerobaculia bacterium]|nr:TIGR04283 family arsenosugar biosynthesis glycosyltransferase [Thermoanaerobaculia bacterium]